MAKQSINTGTIADDGTGSNLRAGGILINANFDEIYTAAGDGSTIDNDRLRNVIGGTGLGTNLVGNDLTISVDGTVVTATSVTTLENKTINLANNTITGTTAQFNTALSDGGITTLAGTETLTNKDLTDGTNTFNITGITNAQLANDKVTLGGTNVELGSTATTLNGLSITGFSQFLVNASASSIRFNHANLASFPSYVTYSGTPALDEDTLKPYIATAAGWVELITENSNIQGLSNVNITGINNGEVIAWNSSTTRFEPNIGAIAGTNLNHDYANINDLGYIGYRSPDNTVEKTVLVTVAVKADTHYHFGTGNTDGFSIDGIAAPALSLAPGKWKFDQADSSNNGHQLHFYREPDKVTQYTDGVTMTGTAGSAGANIVLEVTKDTPEILYYQCHAHDYMGHVINVVGGRSTVSSDNTNTGDSSTVAFTIASGRTVDDILVFVNGSCLVPTSGYTISGTTLTLVSTPPSGHKISIRYIS